MDNLREYKVHGKYLQWKKINNIFINDIKEKNEFNN